MKHSRSKVFLNMPTSRRKALLRALMDSMLKSGKIETTLARAKFFAPRLEKLITVAKVQDLHSMRILRRMLNANSIPLIYDVASRFRARNGGYTRIIKTWRRYGDAAKTAVVEFVN